MNTHSLNKLITSAGLLTVVKTIILGFLLGETWYLSTTVSDLLYEKIRDTRYALFIVVAACSGLFVLTTAYLYIRNFHVDLVRIVRSYRIDILTALLLGVWISVSFGGVGTHKYHDVASSLSPEQLALLGSAPIAIGVLLVLKALVIIFQGGPQRESSFFVSDVEKKTKTDDLLAFSEDASRFAEMVLNGGAPDSLVFGIDAPWGVGKSTFVNFCIEYWEEEASNSAIVYKFSLLRYEDRSNLLEKFVDGLVRTIQKHAYVPEIRPLVSRYSQFLKGNARFSIFGFDFTKFQDTYTVDDAFEDLESVLGYFSKKIIVVVDDLDRLSFSTVKDVLFVIKKSFVLPNVSYVLCYDTENIIAREKEHENADRLLEFLEKFVNVKFSLFLHAEILSRYISHNFDRAVQHNLQLDPYTVDKTKQAISVIGKIYESPEFHNYQSFLGDIRKLKRLINTLLLLEIEKTDFENSDIDKHDLIHLLLIYVNYPSVFRKIFNTETDGKRGFFSLVTPYDDGYPAPEGGETQRDRYSESSYANSRMYSDYLKDRTLNQQFLLNKVFAASERLENARIESVSDEIRNSYACFNGSFHSRGGRNLEAYLNLIVRLSRPQKRNQYRFYLNWKGKLASGKPIDEILEDEEFSFTRGEDSRQQFLRVVVNSAREFSEDISTRLITYLLHHIHEYSLFTSEKVGLGFRDDLPFLLIKLLDTAGWSSVASKRRDNTDENIAEIAEWIFGGDRHKDTGVLDTLGAPSRGPLGLFDLMIFRLYCSADRGGEFFNLQRALSKHGSPSATTSGVTSTIAVEEMREISQRVFRIFKDQYIVPRKNLLELICQLSLEELAGKYDAFLKEKIISGEISEEETDSSAAALKSRMVAFTTYQLSNTFVRSGVGCGYYDEYGMNDGKGISAIMNDYLFGQCFNPDISQRNYEHFVDYLLINLANRLGDDDDRYAPTIAEFAKILDKRKLAEYWRSHSQSIRALNLTSRQKRVVTGNYIASYQEDLEEVYRVLDRLLSDEDTNSD